MAAVQDTVGVGERGGKNGKCRNWPRVNISAAIIIRAVNTDRLNLSIFKVALVPHSKIRPHLVHYSYLKIPNRCCTPEI